MLAIFLYVYYYVDVHLKIYLSTKKNAFQICFLATYWKHFFFFNLIEKENVESNVEKNQNQKVGWLLIWHFDQEKNKTWSIYFKLWLEKWKKKWFIDCTWLWERKKYCKYNDYYKNVWKKISVMYGTELTLLMIEKKKF